MSNSRYLSFENKTFLKINFVVHYAYTYRACRVCRDLNFEYKFNELENVNIVF